MRGLVRTYGLLTAFIVVLLFQGGCVEDEAEKFKYLNPGRDFTLTDHNGKEFRLRDHRGKKILLFFGYLSCPDVCPATLSRITRVGKILGDEIKDLEVIFISVDPQRDTPERLKEYLSFFKVRTIGLTGSAAQIAEVAKEYGASYEKVFLKKDEYLMNHSDYIYLIDSKGKTVFLFHQEDTPQEIASRIKRIR